MDPFSSLTFGRSLSVRVDGAIGAMSLAPNGRDAVLAGRRGLFIIDLEDPFTTPRWLHHITSWEVADVQWSPHQSKPSWCISTSNQKALLWDLSRPSNNAISNVLHHHTRAITDINFHPYDPETLATCSIDTFVLRWDMRTPRKPVAQWAEWRAGATQVKWNHENQWEVASSHDNGFCIWDSRKDAIPRVKVANAHGGKINGLDFTGGVQNFVTCSNDKKVKFWNLTGDGPYAPTVVIAADYPVARARPLPFGRERVVGLMPLRNGDDSVHLVNCDNAYHSSIDTGTTQYIHADPAYSFKGHAAPVKDFLWRTRHESYGGFTSSNRWKDYQLVTWGQDYDLKLWPQDDRIYTAANYNPTHQRILGAIAGEEDPNPSDAKTSRSPLASSPGEEKPLMQLKTLAYDTYCVEPPVTLQGLVKKNNGDKLSALTLYEISKKNASNGTASAVATNNLDWISGVRMGHAGHGSNRDGELGPLNLGEEVSIVGHKFPKVRFEKISVSTGDVVLSLVGPVTTKRQNNQPRSISEASNEAAIEEAEDNDDETTANDAATDGGATSVSNAIAESAAEPPTEDDESRLVFIRVNLKFPKGYPFLETASGPSSSWSASKRAAYIAQHFVSFTIEETHELNKDTAGSMVEALSGIAYFYANKYKRFCLEPCLRFLMGEKVDLDDSNFETGLHDEEEYIQEVGNEGWADDLINQQPDFQDSVDPYDEVDSSGEDIEEFEDLLPGGRDLENSQYSLQRNTSGTGTDSQLVNNKFFDSTPVPKGCGALWSHTGQLVCFFVPKKTDDDESKNFQKFNIFKFTDAGLSVKSKHSERALTIHINAHLSDDSLSSGADLDTGKEHGALDALSETSSETSDDSFSQDWNDIMDDEMRNNTGVPGLFQASFGLGNRYMGNQKGSLAKLASNGDGSVNKTSLHDSFITPSPRKSKKKKKDTNIVGIFDFSHLIPDKYDLACNYRLLGDRPDVLAKYNGDIANTYGFPDLAEIWNILSILLLNGVASSNDYYGSTDDRVPGKRQGFFWGHHPFGHSGLVKDIFKYFEERNSLQMLVTMSCILFEPGKDASHLETEHAMHFTRSVSTASTPRIRPSPMEGTSLERRMFDTGSYMTNILSPPAGFSDHSTPRQYERSINSSMGSSYRESFSEVSTMRRNTFNLYEEAKIRDENSRKYPLKTERIGSDAPAHPDEGPQFSLEMCNVDDLDLFENRNTLTLLDSQDSAKIRLYREEYADMLYLWGLPINRISVLKFNYLDGRKDSSTFIDEHRLKICLRDGQDQQQDGHHLLPSQHTKGPSGAMAWRQAHKTTKYCQFCNLIVAKLAVACNICEHVLHADCAAAWKAETEGTEMSSECPGGCGCNCVYGLN